MGAVKKTWEATMAPRIDIEDQRHFGEHDAIKIAIS